MSHPSPEDLLARLTREMDTNVRHLHGNRLYARPPVKRQRIWPGILLLFIFGVVLTVVDVWLGAR